MGIIPKPPILGLTDILSFGKYKGKSISFVISLDPEYLDWVTSFKGIIHLDKEATVLLENNLWIENEYLGREEWISD